MLLHDIIPRVSREEKLRSLGWFVIWWIESFCVVGSDPVADMPVRLSPEYAEFLVNCYALDKRGRRLFDRVFLSRPKGCNKSGLGALVVLAESLARVRFDHWAEEGEVSTFLGKTYVYREGEPVGRVIQGPRVVCAANSEDQAGNVYDVVLYNCLYGPLSQLRGYGLDPGQTRIMLPDGGWIKPVTAGAASKDGGLQTFIELDESHLMTGNAKKMAHTLIRNGAKRKRDAEPWVLETTTMYQPGADSLAEDTYKTAWAVRDGRARHDQRTLFDHRYASLPLDELSDTKKLRRALMESYGSAALSSDGRDHLILPDGRVTAVDARTGCDEFGNSLASAGVEPGPSKDGWQDLDGQMNNVLNAGNGVDDSVRYFLNSLTSVSDAWIPEPDIQSHLFGRSLFENVDTSTVLDVWKQVIASDDEITLGFDGSVSDDSTALVGCRVRDGLLFLIKLASKPDGPEGVGWRVDRDAFDGMVRYMFAHYKVVGFFADVNPWESMIAQWEQDFSDVLRVAPRNGSAGKIRFWTNAWSRDVYQALETVATNFKYEWEPVGRHAKPSVQQVALLADSRLVNHFRNARRREKSFGYLVFKETPNSPNKIDAMMAGLLAYSARMKFLSAGVEEVDDSFIPYRVY